MHSFYLLNIPTKNKIILWTANVYITNFSFFIAIIFKIHIPSLTIYTTLIDITISKIETIIEANK